MVRFDVPNKIFKIIKDHTTVFKYAIIQLEYCHFARNKIVFIKTTKFWDYFYFTTIDWNQLIDDSCVEHRTEAEPSYKPATNLQPAATSSLLEFTTSLLWASLSTRATGRWPQWTRLTVVGCNLQILVLRSSSQSRTSRSLSVSAIQFSYYPVL